MGQQISREDARSSLLRAGLSASEARLERIAQGIQVARDAAATLAALDMGYRGPASFRAPPPAEVQRIHGN